MKKTFTLGAGLLTLLILFVFACQKFGKEEAAEATELPSTITTIYEREIVDVDSSILGDHVWKIETISLNDALLQPFKNDPQWTNHSLASKLDVTKPIKRYWYDFTGIRIIEVPLVNSSKVENVFIYTFKDQFLFVRATMETLLNGNKKLLYESLGGTVYYGLEVNTEGMVGNFFSENQIPFQETYTHATEQDRADAPSC